MKKFIKDKWIKALLSGEYKQVYHQLIGKDNEACAIGVLRQCFPEQRFPYWFIEHGLNSTISRHITDMNDKEKLPFAQIATYISNNVPEEE